MTALLYFVELTVCDLDASVDWYREVMGLHEVMRDGANTFALLAAGGTKLALKRLLLKPGTRPKEKIHRHYSGYRSLSRIIFW